MTRLDPSARSWLIGLIGLIAAAVLVAGAQATPAAASGGEIRHERSRKAIPGEYVIVLDDAGLNKRQPDTVINFLARGHQATDQVPLPERVPRLRRRDEPRPGAAAIEEPGGLLRPAKPGGRADRCSVESLRGG